MPKKVGNPEIVIKWEFLSLDNFFAGKMHYRGWIKETSSEEISLESIGIVLGSNVGAKFGQWKFKWITQFRGNLEIESLGKLDRNEETIYFRGLVHLTTRAT